MPTSRPKLKVIVTRRLPEPVETRMSELFDVELNATDTPMTIEQLAEAAKGMLAAVGSQVNTEYKNPNAPAATKKGTTKKK